MFIKNILLALASATLLASASPTSDSSSSHGGGKHHDKDFKARNLRTIQTIYNLTSYPNNVPILVNGTQEVPPGLFAANATGRITPIGNFTGFNDSAEYFFALTAIPSAQNNYLAFFAADIVSFTSECPEVATSVVYLNMSNLDPATGRPTTGNFYPLKQIALWRFDESGAVVQYEAWIPNLQFFVSAQSGGSVPLYGNDPKVDAGTIAALCPTIQQLCVGPNQQYADVAECTAVLTSKPFGNYDETWGDDVVCRSLHILLARLRPEVHCPHVGKVGGSQAAGFKCTAITYQKEYFDDVDLFGGDGHPFMCTGKNQYHHVRSEVEGPAKV